MLWEEGDQIAILSTSSYDPLTLTAGAGTTSGTFEGLVHEPENDCIVIYPYTGKKGNNTIADGFYTVAWGINNVGGTNQVAEKNGFWPSTPIMAGLIDADGNVAFKNLVSFVKLEIEFRCSSITFQGNGDEYVGADGVKFNFDENGVPTNISAYFGQSTSVNMTGLNAEKIEAGTYYIGVVPQTLEDGFTLIFTDYDSDNKEVKKCISTRKSVTLERSGILNLGCIRATDLETYVPVDDFEGQGTTDNPFIINSKNKLTLLANFIGDDATYATYADKCYKQTRNIDFEGGTIQIGSESKPFKGTYDGGGHSISNYVAGSPNGRSGLFGAVHNASLLRMVISPKSVNIAWPDDLKAYYGGLAAIATSDKDKYVIIKDCHLTAEGQAMMINLPDDVYLDYGGMIGKCCANIQITSCSNDASLRTTPGGRAWKHNLVTVGSMIGRVSSPDTRFVKIDRCRNTGNIDANHVGGISAGGFIGEILETEIGDDETVLYLTNSVNNGNVTALSRDFDTANAGGLVGNHAADGWASTDPYVCNCLNTGNVLATGRNGCAGGLFGQCYDKDTRVYCCANTGDVSGIYPGMPARDVSDLENYRKLGALCGSEGGYFSYCRWTNNSDMSVVYGSHDYGYESFYTTVITSKMMNDIQYLINNGPGVEYYDWTGTTADGSLDLDF